MKLTYLKIKILFFVLAFNLFLCSSATAQDIDSTKTEQPALKIFREAESYAYLKNEEQYKKEFCNIIKYIPLNNTGSINLSFGGQVRSRFEHFTNRLWKEDNDQDFYSQRIALHTNISLGKNIRVFGEIYNGLTSGERQFAQNDNAAIFQAFIDYTAFLSNDTKLVTRLGRQELSLGVSRLVGIREGPNIRRSFDMGKLLYTNKQFNTQIFYGKEVIPQFGAFDNEFSLFDTNAPNTSLWGVYSQFKILKISGTNELYYLGFKGSNIRFNDVLGDETRHTLGFRRFGKLGNRLQYNTEFIYQFGKTNNNDISTYSLATDAYYKINESSWQPEVGLKLEYSSGDKKQADGKINSFNPMFVNPAHYSLAGMVTPVNMISIHPSAKAYINKKLKLYIEWAIFWKNSSNDALYTPTRFVFLPANNSIESKNIGHQFGFMSSYNINKHLSFNMDISYFIAGEYLDKEGLNNNIFHIAPTISYKF